MEVAKGARLDLYRFHRPQSPAADRLACLKHESWDGDLVLRAYDYNHGASIKEASSQCTEYVEGVVILSEDNEDDGSEADFGDDFYVYDEHEPESDLDEFSAQDNAAATTTTTTTAATISTSTTKNAIGLLSKPCRIDGMKMIPGFSDPRKTRLPVNVSLEKICEDFPNHLYGKTLDSFLLAGCTYSPLLYRL
jgi:hypothetical protein